MATLDRLVVQMALENRTRAGLKTMEGDFDGTLRRVQKSAALTERTLSNVGKNFGQNININRVLSAGRAFDQVNQRAGLLRGTLFATTAALGGFGAALGSNVFARYADTFTQINNQIRPLTKDSAELASRFDAVSKVADRSRSGLRETATLYARIQKSLPNLDVGKTLEVTETIQKALQLGGATTQEAASAAIQFSQALSSNRLGGEELRTILETPLGAALAKGLGVSLGELRKLSIEGKLTAKVLIDALGKIGPDVQKQFSASVRTLDQALVQADNRLTEYVGTINDSYGATKIFGDAILGLANNLELLGKIAGPAAIAAGAIFAGRLAGGSAKSGLLSSVGASAATLTSIGSGAVAKGANEIAKKQLAEASDKLGEAAAKVARLKALSKEDTISEFSGSEANAAEKAKREIKKIEDEKLAQNKKLIAAQKALADVTVITSKEQIKQTNRAIAAEKKLLDIQESRRRAVNALKFNPNYADAQKQLAKADKKLPDAINAAADRAAIVATASATAQNNAAKERLKYLKQIDAAERSIIALETQAPSAANAVFATAAVRDAAAAKGYTSELARLTTAANDSADSLLKHTKYLELSERAMTKTARAGAVFGKAISGTVGFLGGPFGFAITSLVVGLELYGIAAAKSAADTDKVNRMIEELGIVAGGSDGKLRSLGESLSGINAANLRQEIEDAKYELEKITTGGGLLDRILPGNRVNAQSVANSARNINFLDSGLVKSGNKEAAQEIQRIALELRDAPEKANELRRQLDKIGKLRLSQPLNELLLLLNDLIDRADKASQLVGLKSAQQDPVFSATNQAASAVAYQTKLDDAKAVVDNTIATALQTDAEKELIVEMGKLREELSTKGLEGALTDTQYRQEARRVISSRNEAKDIDAAIAEIKRREGRLLEVAKYDVNAPRVGFSSDTKTDANGRVSQVKFGDTSTLDEANRDLARRTAESLKNIREQVGSAIYDTLSQSQKAILTGIGYNSSNKGLLPSGIADAVKSGKNEDVASEIRAFGRRDRNAKNGLTPRYDASADEFLQGDAGASKIDAQRKSYAELLRGADAARKAIEAETAAIGQSVYQKTLATKTNELLAKATEDGQILSAKETSEIKAKAAAFAEAEAAKAQSEFAAETEEDAKKKIATLQEETKAIGLNAAEVAKAAFIKERLAKADSDGIILSEKAVQQINREAEAIAKAAQLKAESEFEKEAEKNSTDKISDLERETAALSLNEVAAAKAAFSHELYELAKSKGITSSPALKAEIDAATLAYGRQFEAIERIKTQQEVLNEINESFKGSLKGLVTDLANGKNFMDSLTDAASRLADKLLDMSLDGLLDGLFGGGNSGGGGLISGLIGGLVGGGGGGGLAGARAGGGPVSAGRSYLVGERGMERFTPSTNGFITPNNRLDPVSQPGAKSVRTSNSFNIKIDVSGARTERELLSTVERVAEMAVRKGIAGEQDRAVQRSLRS